MHSAGDMRAVFDAGFAAGLTTDFAVIFADVFADFALLRVTAMGDFPTDYLCARSIVIRRPMSLGDISTLLTSASVSATNFIT